MTRSMLVRQGADEKLIPETPLPLEKDLHDVLTLHPALLPAEDLGLGTTVVVGRESSLTSGYADLVLVDDRGQLCLVEVKKEGNPDTRQVVAQLLDYAAALWGQTVGEFESGVVAGYLAHLDDEPQPVSLTDHLARAFGDDEAAAAAAALAIERLEQTLAAGDFTLVVAAPEIPVGVQRVLDYLNARGQRLFALEVSYFKGPAECFVPRLVTMPTVSGGGMRSLPQPVDVDAFIASLPDPIQDAVRTFLRRAVEAGAEVAWYSYGASIKISRAKTRQVAYLEPKRLGAIIQPPADFPPEPFGEVAARLSELGLGQASEKGWAHTVPWAGMTPDQADAVFEVVLDAIRGLATSVTWVPLSPARAASFTRNDNNLWVKHVSALSELQGQHLRGSLRHVASGQAEAIELVPLAGAAPGWRPRFPEGGAVWPAGTLEGDYDLQVEQVASSAAS
jgi:hypothetical protein